MFSRITRSRSTKDALVSAASRPLSVTAAAPAKATRTLTSSFKVTKDHSARKPAAKATVAASSAATVGKKTTRTSINRRGKKGEQAALEVVTEDSTTVTSSTTTVATIGTVLPIVPAAASAATSQSNSFLSPHALLEQGLQHLRTTSPLLSQWIDNEDYSHILRPYLRTPSDPPANYFRSLARGIISQQVSGAAAASILSRFIALFYKPTLGAPEPGQDFFPTPQQVLDTSIETLRSAGLSERKAEYMKSLATEFLNDPSLSDARSLEALSDDEIKDKLIKVKGIGVWSVEMFLIFTMGRWDVFSVGDLGIQRGMAVWSGKDVEKLKRMGKDAGRGGAKWKYMSEQDMLRLSAQFQPWRSLFCLVMWKASDTKVESLKENGKGKRKGKKVAEEVVEEVVEKVVEKTVKTGAKKGRGRKKAEVVEEVVEEAVEEVAAAAAA
ncbi:DNA glycosylase [Kalaharituber pfeilii]|nr:DNA glycosylase [Kalaharituber pfeilii]